ncbi:MAG: response regulator transcription factor [Clostridiales bacterium]|nr:response regulator transcription factor [Clostridiales bacterium]
MSRILIVEDEPRISRYLELELRHEGYDVQTAFDGVAGLDAALSGNFDLVLLDLMLPGMSGIEVCRRIRRQSDVPIIILTAKDDVSDKVAGLDTGADDYITKPFAIEELLARIRAVLKRRGPAAQQEMIRIGPVEIHTAGRQVFCNGEPIELTKKEYDLLEYLARHENTVLTRNQLLDQVWGYEYVGDANVVDVYVRYLRAKIDQKYNIRLICTVRGVGYSLRYDPTQAT